MTIKTGNPETDQMFVELAQLTRESLDISNDLLPEEYRDNRSKRTSLEFIHRRERKLNPGPSKAALEKAERARRVQLMAAKYENEGEVDLTVEPDEDKLYRRELDFCAAAVRAGWMSFDEEE